MLLGEGEYAESASSFTLFVFIFFCISLLKSIWHYLMEFLVYLKLWGVLDIPLRLGVLELLVRCSFVRSLMIDYVCCIFCYMNSSCS